MRIACTALLLVLSCCSAAQEIRAGELAGRAVELRVVKADDLSFVTWPPGPIEIKQVSATVTGGANIYMLLKANGIAPDSGAFSIVYDLNPTIKDVDNLVDQTSIQLPSVTPAPELKGILSQGSLIEITVDPEARGQLNFEIEALQRFEPSLNQLTPDQETQARLKSLLDWYLQIEKRFKRKTDPPLRHATLLELRSEADLLNSILKAAVQDNRLLNDADKLQVGSIYDDLKLEITQYGQVLAGTAPKSEAFYAVTVVIKGVDAKLLEHLRVYYTYNGLFRTLPANPPITSFGFARLGSGTSENLLMKNYQIWAAKDGDSNHPITTPFFLRIDSTSPASLTVDLSLAEAQR